MKSSLKYMMLGVPLVLLMTASASACVGLPDLNTSLIWQNFPGLATLRVQPDGSGPPLTEARVADGTVVDATLHLALNNSCPEDGPVVGFPREDMWLESLGGGMMFCPGGSIADGPTDEDGHTQWSQPLTGGGWDEGNCRVLVAGDPLGSLQGQTVNFNSPDLNGDQVVNLIDVGLFAQDYYGEYHFRSDLARDGVLNLSDLYHLAVSVGQSCP